MDFSNLNYINTGKDGILHETTEQDIDTIFDALKTQPKVALHFHGGLNSRATGMKGAERLTKDCYEGSGAHPVFFVWESGLIEVIKHNFGEIFGEDIFKILLKWLLKYATAKLDAGGAKSPLFVTPTDMAIYTELSKLDAGKEPFDGLKIAAVSEMTDNERQSFEAALSRDSDLQETVQAIVNAVVPEVQSLGAKGVTVRTRRSARTLMSPDVVEQLKADTEAAKAGGQPKGIFSTAVLIKKAAVILIRVVRRFAQKRDHGLYLTVVEELLREFYVANIGTNVWSAMKMETFDTFQGSGGPTRGGDYFTRKLGHLLATGQRPKITLVGHSTGAVFVNNLLTHIQKMQTGGKIPADFKFQNIVFLAPACTFEHFLPSITIHRGLFDNCRIFTMTDKAESDDSLVPGIYTRSLLYFISGVLEPDGKGDVDFDKPILGMERYHVNTCVYTFPEVVKGRDFIANTPISAVWSPTALPWPAGMGSTSLKHGDFDDDKPTLESVRHIISIG